MLVMSEGAGEGEGGECGGLGLRESKFARNFWGRRPDSPKTLFVAMPTIKIRVRTPARQVMLDVDDGITVADLKKKVSARD
jgi:hypothetical protein